MNWPTFFVLIFQCLNVALGQSHSCSFQDDSTGYALSWSAGIGFVDFFFSYKKFPTRTAHWTGVAFGDQNLRVALVESQYGRVTISSAAMVGNQPPLKLPTENMVTRGYGSIDEDRLKASFSVPIYYFQSCEKWSFFTTATQIGIPYMGTPRTKTICNVTNLCVAPKLPHKFKAYPSQDSSSSSSLNIQLPNEVTQFLDQPIDADIDLKGGIHLGQNSQNNANIRFSPAPQSNYNYDQQYGYQSQSQQQQFGVNQNSNNQQYGYQSQSQQPFGVNQNSNNQQQAFNQQPFGVNQNPYNQNSNANTQNTSAFAVDNPNYKFLPDGLNYQYDANSGRQRFYDNNGNPIGNRFGSTNEPVLSNTDQNKLNYQDISSRGASNPQNNQQFTNNIYGYDYRSNSGSKYTINGKFDIDVRASNNANSGNEQQYQPPQTQRFPNGRRKRQSTFRGTAYQNQDIKFPRTENTIPASANTIDDTVDFNTNTNNNFNQQRAFYDTQNSQSQGSLYYPYRTDTSNGNSQQYQQLFNDGYGIFGPTNNLNSAGPVAPYYLNSNTNSNNNNNQFSNGDEIRQFDQNPYSTQKYNPANKFYNQTNNATSNTLNGNPNNNNFNNQNTRFNPATHPDIHQYDDPSCQGQDPPFCKDYVKRFEQWFRSYGGSQNQGMCAELKKSLYHSDHHCCQSLKTVNC